MDTEETNTNPSGVRGMIVSRGYPIETAMGLRQDSWSPSRLFLPIDAWRRDGGHGEQPQLFSGASFLFPFTSWEGVPMCTYTGSLPSDLNGSGHRHVGRRTRSPLRISWHICGSHWFHCMWCGFITRFRPVDVPQHARLLDYFCGCCRRGESEQKSCKKARADEPESPQTSKTCVPLRTTSLQPSAPLWAERGEKTTVPFVFSRAYLNPP